eukprot:a174385_2496.p1 GENE.a174385_2496~~a174385_2496.p1  ORF type:complete len:292 (+),score=107.80 a174385_2496:33-878(+)
MADYQVTDEDIKQIATGFLLSAPPGEFAEVAQDVRTLVGNDALLNTVYGTVAQTYNTEQMVAVNVPGQSHQCLLTKYNEETPTTYLDPRSRLVLTVDHAKVEVTSTSAAPAGGKYEGHRAALDTAIQAYCENHYPNGVASVFASDNGLVVCISAAKFSPSNYWNGRWRSVWTINFAPGAAQGSMEGRFKVAVHLYEDGNVQLGSDFTKNVDVAIGSAADAAEAIVAEIAKAEQSYEAGLDESYASMAERTFKVLRRKLPVTRRLMDWEKSAAYRVGKDIAS